MFDLEVPPPPLPPPLPLRALRRPGAAALEREAMRVAQETAAIAAACDADPARQPAVPAQQRFGFANLDLPAGFVSCAGTRRSSCSSGEGLQEMPLVSRPQRRSGLARLGLSVKAVHEDDWSSNNHISNSRGSSSTSPPKVPILAMLSAQNPDAAQ